MLNRLRQHNLDQYALGEMSCPKEASNECNCRGAAADPFHMNDRATLGYVADQLTDDVLSISRQYRSAASLWSHLADEYGSGKGDQREALLMQLKAHLDALPFSTRPDKI